jgi:hypothetical protein
MHIKEDRQGEAKDPGAAYYEERFEFPFWTLVKQRAQKKDISYSDAAAEVAPEYADTLRIRDEKWTDAQITKRQAEGNKEVMATDRKI